jgi:hypothetical protein
MITDNKVYVAGASSERNERAKHVMAALKAAGYVITHDWTTSVDMNCGPDHQPIVDDATLTKCAEDDYLGVVVADIFVLLAPQNASTGAWVELGIALGKLGPARIYIAGDISKCIFALLIPKHHRFATDVQLIEYLVRRE